MTIGEKELDLRVSVIPTAHGQSVVMRILDKDSIKVGLRQLGFSEPDFAKIQEFDPASERDYFSDGADWVGKNHVVVCCVE